MEVDQCLWLFLLTNPQERKQYMDTMFDTLLQLPLFQGLAQEDFTCILEKVKLHFTRYKAGETIVQAGENCDRLLFILKGEVSLLTTAQPFSYTFIEHIPAPGVIEPQSLFGMSTCYVANYVALTEVHTVSIEKSFVLSRLFQYDICRLNYMNLIGYRAQNFYKRTWSAYDSDLRKRIAAFILKRAERPLGVKILKIKLEELAEMIFSTRANVSKVLNAMQEEGLVELHRSKIIVPQAEKLAELFA